MDSNHNQQLDLVTLLLEMSDGAASEENRQRLDRLVREDAAACQRVVATMTHLADLEWETRSPTRAHASDTVESVAATTLPRTNATVTAPRTSVAEPRVAEPRTGTTAPLPVPLATASTRALAGWTSLVAAFALGVAVTWWGLHAPNELPLSAEIALPAAGDLPRVIPAATLVSHTSALWDAHAGIAMEAGDRLHPGKSLALFDGVAELEFEGGASLRIQGPAILALSAAGIPELKYGKIVTNHVRERSFRLDVPMASTYLPAESLVGIDAFGEEVVVHTLEGSATIVPHARNGDRITVEPGKAVRLRKDARSDLAIFNALASPSTFEFEGPGEHQALVISPAYVTAVKQSAPAAYWRFEAAGSRLVPDETGDGPALQLVGEHVQIVRRDQNVHAEFAIRETTGCFMPERPLHVFAGAEYSVEFWVQPDHFHRGALVSLVACQQDDLGTIERHGLIVETHSTNPFPGGPESRPKRIRFHHRSPPHELLHGSSCFADKAYEIRKWQHVAVVKRATEMELFINGRLAGIEHDATQLPKQLSLVVGQLFSFGAVRPFVGRLDELAIYDRALSTGEIQQRIELTPLGI